MQILSEYEKPPVVREFFPGGWHHEDKEGRPLFILRLGQMDVKGIVKSVGEEVSSNFPPVFNFPC